MQSCTQQAWEDLRDRLKEAIKAHVPTKVRRDPNKPAWLSKEILRKIRRKRRLWKQAKSRAGMEEYKAAVKEVNNMVRNAKRRWEKKLASDKMKNSKPFYAYVKKRTKTRTTVGPIRSRDGGLTKNDKETAEELNEFFSSVFTREDQEVPTPEIKPTQTKLTRPRITTADVRKKLKDLRVQSAAGPDGIGPRL